MILPPARIDLKELAASLAVCPPTSDSDGLALRTPALDTTLNRRSLCVRRHGLDGVIGGLTGCSPLFAAPVVYHPRVKLRQVLRSCGYDLIRFPPHSDNAMRRVQLLHAFNVETVLDGGAGTGRYGHELRRYGYTGAILSFEPLERSFAVLRAATESDRRWTARKEALGLTSGMARLYVSGNPDSSSLLEMRQRHRDAAAGSQTVETVDVKVTRLDDVEVSGPTFVKLDLQGGERAAMLGGRAMLEVAVGLQLELSLVSLYTGDMLLEEALELTRALGMVLHHVEPGFSDPRTGRLLQFDGTFFRE